MVMTVATAAAEPSGRAVLQDAWAHYHKGEFAAAQLLAAKAATMAGPQHNDAIELYGDSLFKLGEYARARNVYAKLVERVAQNKREPLRAKIADCDRALQKTG